MSKMDEIVPLIKEVINERNFILPINGTSMIPLLHNGDYAVLSKPQNIRKNDVILYQREDGKYVLHRIFRVKKDFFVLLGDHQVKKEYPIFQRQIIAKMIAYKKGNKEYCLDNFKYKMYLLIWNRLWLRRVLLKFFR